MVALELELLRHGETTAGQCYLGRTDAALTEAGWQQMVAALAQRSPTQYEAVLSSPLRRCAEFAEYWCGAEGWQMEAGLREYDFGDWDGCTAAEIQAADPQALARFWQDPWRYPPPRAESLATFFARLEALLQRLEQAYSGPVLLICHGGVIRALHCIVQQRPVSAMFEYAAPHGSLHRFSRAGGR